MIEVNVSNLKLEVDKISKIIEEYDEIMLNLFRYLLDSYTNWQDSNSILFSQKIGEERLEMSNYFDILTQKKDVLKYLYDRYSEIGKKISINLNSKNIILGIIDDCYRQASDIRYSFEQIDTSFYYDERQTILNQKDEIYDVMEELRDIRSNISELYTKIEGIELEIHKKISNIEQIKINEFEFEF